MATRPAASAQHHGPISWQNWRAKLAGAPYLGSTEVKLFSDAWFIAEARDCLGPYELINPVPQTLPGVRYDWKPAIVLRTAFHLPQTHTDMTATDDDHYHGGWMYDEIAALISVLLGARIVAGPTDREFNIGEDPLGRPRAQSVGLLPTLPSRTRRPIIPHLLGQRDLRNLGLLESFHSLDNGIASTLIKCARLYQNALWVCDTSPETSWLLFVSAIETAAGHWSSDTSTPAERLADIYPAVASMLASNADGTLLEKVAGELNQLIGSTRRFTDFCVEFAPPPPEARPTFAQFEFSGDSYRAAMKKIYRYRSQALHGGKPFPHTMCSEPDEIDDGLPAEKPNSLAASAMGSTWVAEDLPLYLHTFEYITRNALTRWWASVVPEPQ